MYLCGCLFDPLMRPDFSVTIDVNQSTVILSTNSTNSPLSLTTDSEIMWDGSWSHVPYTNLHTYITDKIKVVK